MIKALLIDDEPLARSIVKEFLQSHKEINIVAECGDGFEGLKAIMQHQPQLIFLDIQMPKINGFEMLELIEQPPAVIFTTAFDEFAIRAFETHAIDYLLKPFTQERFNSAIRKFFDQYESGGGTIPSQQQQTVAQLLSTTATSTPQNQRIVVKVGNKIKIIPIQDIYYLEAADDYVNVATHAGSYLKNKTMNFFEMNLDAIQFVRIHRSYIVNLNQVVRIDPYEKDGHVVLLKSGKQIPVSKSGYLKLKSALGV